MYQFLEGDTNAMCCDTVGLAATASAALCSNGGVA